jgi:PBP1b-binding outer membrane lipoprotein LpoB
MRIIFCILLLTGCSALFNADKYNPNPTPKPVVEEVCCDKDTVKTDTIKVIIIE